MAKSKSKPWPRLTPPAPEVLTLVENSVAPGRHDDDGEIVAIAKTIRTTPIRLQSILRKLEEQGRVMVKRDFF